MTRDAFYEDAVFAALYDATCNADRRDFDACRELARGRSSVLDLGCGTGELAVSLALQGRMVVGVDPADAMLEVARERPGGDKVHWVEGDAAMIDLGRRFDLIVMTGNAFQCILSDPAQNALFAVVARHLAKDGLMVFDTRNPAAFTPWRRETTERRLVTREGEEVTWWATAAEGQPMDRLWYTQHFRDGAGTQRTAMSCLRFSDPEELAARMAAAGLAPDLFGSWDWTPFLEQSVDCVWRVSLAGVV